MTSQGTQGTQGIPGQWFTIMPTPPLIALSSASNTAATSGYYPAYHPTTVAYAEGGGRYHLQFIDFPNGSESTFWRWVSADGDDEVEIASAAMEMVDYAIEHAPDLFGVDMANGIYATAEQELELLERIMECVDGKDYHEVPDHLGGRQWYQDAVLAVGYPQHRIVVRVSYHEGK